jgi:hypothetical protein
MFAKPKTIELCPGDNNIVSPNPPKHPPVSPVPEHEVSANT